MAIIILSAWFISHFEPLQYLLSKFKHKKPIIDTIFLGIRKVLGCQYCLAFWLGLVVMQNLPCALAVSFVAFWLTKIELAI